MSIQGEIGLRTMLAQTRKKRSWRREAILAAMPIGEVVTARVLGAAANLSERSVAQGVAIDGEAGVGYMRRERRS